MITAQIKNLKKVLSELDQFEEEVNKKVEIVTKANAQDIELGAKQLAPVDMGFLRNQISTEKNPNKIAYKVVANAPYSAYMEFGTGGLVEVPKELKDVAIQFKGRGVKKINIAPRPYLYPAFVKGRSQYVKDLEKLLDDLGKKHSD